MDIDTKDLKLVAAVVAEGTLTAAARRMGVSQSAASHHLARLEERLGTTVFHRSGTGMTPTTAGRRILRSADAILAELDDLDQELHGIARGSIGQVRLTAQCYTGYHWLPRLLAEYRRSDPGVEIGIVPEAASDPVSAVLLGDVEIALAYDFSPANRLAAIPLFDDELVLVAAPEHRLAEGTRIRPEDLEDEHLLAYNREPVENLFLRRVLLPSGVRPRRISEIRLTEGILALVEAGVGVAVMTRWTAAPRIAAGKVRALPLGERGLHRKWHALALREVTEQPHVRRLLTLLADGPARLFGEADEKIRRASGLRIERD
ncbi:MAG: LysR family transcriptional regulator [Gemmatimonadales bacterium]|jgi:LysR family transcriptional regulator for metE and metH